MEEIKKKPVNNKKYKGSDKIAEKYKLTEKQKVFVDTYLATGNNTMAYRAAKWTLENKEEWKVSDWPNWWLAKQNPKILAYIHETAMECAQIQMDIIRDDKMPPAVRNDAIKDRLNRAWIWREEQQWASTFVENMTITIEK